MLIANDIRDGIWYKKYRNVSIEGRRSARTMKKEKTTYVLAAFSLQGHPRFKRGTGYGGYLWWSKPQIYLQEVRLVQRNQSVEFDRTLIRIAEHSAEKIVLSIRKNADKRNEVEYLTFTPNHPVKMGIASNLNDASSEEYFGCWTSKAAWVRYFLAVKWDRWKDDRAHDLIDLPTYFTRRSMRNYFRFRYQQLRNLIEDQVLPQLYNRKDKSGGKKLE